MHINYVWKRNMIIIAFFLCFTLASNSFAQIKYSDSSTDVIASRVRVLYASSPILVEVIGVCKAHSEIIQMPPHAWEQIRGASEKPPGLGGIGTGSKGQVSVGQTKSGIVVITWPGISDHLMNVEIDDLKMSEAQRYSVVDILSALLDTREACASMDDLKMRPVVTLLGVTPQPSPGKPHLAGSISNTTFEGVLKFVLRKFGGVMIYQECAFPDGSKRIGFRYYYPDIKEGNGPD